MKRYLLIFLCITSSPILGDQPQHIAYASSDQISTVISSLANSILEHIKDKGLQVNLTEEQLDAYLKNLPQSMVDQMLKKLNLTYNEFSQQFKKTFNELVRQATEQKEALKNAVDQLPQQAQDKINSRLSAIKRTTQEHPMLSLCALALCLINLC